MMKFFWSCVFCFIAIDAQAYVIGAEYDTENPWTDDIEINAESSLDDLIIINNGVIAGTITISGNVAVTIQNNGEILNPIVCDECLPVNISQIIADSNSINPVPGLSGHTVVVQSSATEIQLADVIAISGNAAAINLENVGVIVNADISDVHPPIYINSTNSVNFIVNGLPNDWNGDVPILTGIHNQEGTHDVQAPGIDTMFVAHGRIFGGALYVDLDRETRYSIVLENEMGDWLDDLRDDNPDDKLLDALDNAWSRADLNDILSRSMRTNPIKLMDPVRSFNTFMLGDHIHDLAFGIVAEPFYIYSGDFSVLGGGVGVSGRVAKNLMAKFGIYAGKMDYSGDLDDFNGMLYGANFGALYKDSDFYVRAVGTVSSASFSDIEVFDGTRGVKNPSGLSGAGIVDGGLVFRLFDEFDLTPFVGARFDYAHVLNFSDTDVNMRFGLNIDKETTVDGNRYAFGLSAVGQTNGDIYGAIYTDIMSVVDGIGGRLQFGILNDDFGMSYRISLDAKFAF